MALELDCQFVEQFTPKLGHLCGLMSAKSTASPGFAATQASVAANG